MPIETRLTRRLKIQHPIILAPMDPAAGGRLANAVTGAGGLGLIGGGYGDAERIEHEFREAGNALAAASSRGRWRKRRICSI
jgi:nitronate monooxygenase